VEICDEGFPAENEPLGVEKGKPAKEGEKNCEPEPISGEDGERLEPVLYVRPSRHFGVLFPSTCV